MSDENVNEYIDMDEGLKRVLNNKHLFLRLLKKFADETNLSALNDAINSNDLQTAREKAHTIKGISANLSLKKLFLAIQALEAKVKDGITDAEMMKSVQTIFDETIKNIEKVVDDYGDGK